jgi:hypothetical protein
MRPTAELDPATIIFLIASMKEQPRGSLRNRRRLVAARRREAGVVKRRVALPGGQIPFHPAAAKSFILHPPSQTQCEPHGWLADGGQHPNRGLRAMGCQAWPPRPVSVGGMDAGDHPKELSRAGRRCSKHHRPWLRRAQLAGTPASGCTVLLPAQEAAISWRRMEGRAREMAGGGLGMTASD